MNKEEPVLKNCPFCGEIATFDREGFNVVIIKCLGCPARMKQKFLRLTASELKELMAKDWNKRE